MRRSLLGELPLGILLTAIATPPGKERPTEFSSIPDSEHILVTFER
jgi:hypothetical protein